jgi:NAD(P)-dependent dehydrogenase (short-subunit alcohol dehydrogenase family)
MSTLFNGKMVIITGANGNLGTAVTSHFLEKGYKIIATTHDEEGKNGLPNHENLQVRVINLTNETESASFIQSCIDENKKIDAALMLVGGFAMGSIATTSTDDIKSQIALNFDTAYHVARPLFTHMLANNNGRLVFIGARPSLQVADGKNMVAYSLSKSLLLKLAEFINETAKGKNVTAAVVVPSTLDTLPNRKSMPHADPSDWVKPQALAEILEFVVSDKAAVLRESVLKVYNNA